VIGKREGGVLELTARFAETSALQQQVAQLRVMPCLALRIVGTRPLCCHSHAIERRGEIALELERVGDTGIGGRAGTQRAHAIERCEGLVVIAQLEMRITDYAVVERVARILGACPVRFADRIAKSML
jgi:hypothetical protein